MDRDELTLAIAGALVGAVLLGWLLRGVFTAMNRSTGPRSIRQAADMAQRLHAAEEALAATEARLREVQSDLGSRLEEVQAELADSHATLERERKTTEEIRAAYRAATGAASGDARS